MLCRELSLLADLGLTRILVGPTSEATLTLSLGELEKQLGLRGLKELVGHHGTTLFWFTVPGEKALAVWKDLRDKAPQLSYWPVIFGDPKHLQRFAELVVSNHATPPQETLQAAAKLDVQEFLERRTEEFSDEHAHGQWPPSIQAMGDFTLPRNILKQGEFLKSVDIGIVPAKHGWEVPAQICFGGWNDCPMPEEQVAVLRYWNETYGAELVGASNDVLELRVARRPSSKEEALRLAQEQFWFCYDIVDQGVGTIENLAATLLVSDIWYFWWD